MSSQDIVHHVVSDSKQRVRGTRVNPSRNSKQFFYPSTSPAQTTQNETMDPVDRTNSLTSFSAEDLSPLEQDVLDEYERLAENMKKVPSFQFFPHHSQMCQAPCPSEES